MRCIIQSASVSKSTYNICKQTHCQQFLCMKANSKQHEAHLVYACCKPQQEEETTTNGVAASQSFADIMFTFTRMFIVDTAFAVPAAATTACRTRTRTGRSPCSVSALSNHTRCINARRGTSSPRSLTRNCRTRVETKGRPSPSGMVQQSPPAPALPWLSIAATIASTSKATRCQTPRDPAPLPRPIAHSVQRRLHRRGAQAVGSLVRPWSSSESQHGHPAARCAGSRPPAPR
jgi:hypothetical protein